MDRLSTPTSFVEIPAPTTETCPPRITSAQAREDVRMLRYLFENAYSGRTYWAKQGVDFAGIHAQLEQAARWLQDPGGYEPGWIK